MVTKNKESNKIKVMKDKVLVSNALLHCYRVGLDVTNLVFLLGRALHFYGNVSVRAKWASSILMDSSVIVHSLLCDVLEITTCLSEFSCLRSGVGIGQMRCGWLVTVDLFTPRRKRKLSRKINIVRAQISIIHISRCQSSW